MRGRISSKWNKEVIRILATSCVNHQKASSAYSDLPKRSLDYYIDMVKGQLERGRNTWRSAQPKTGYEGTESVMTVEQRLIDAKEGKLRRGRKHSRRLSVSLSLDGLDISDHIRTKEVFPKAGNSSEDSEVEADRKRARHRSLGMDREAGAEPRGRWNEF